MKKILQYSIPIIIIGLAIFIWWRYFFVFAEGVKAGSLNYFEKKGFIFKTYEGRLVQEGFESPKEGQLQSHEFRFSVDDPLVAKKLERASGKFVELRYQEYLAPLAWRGAARHVVIEVIHIKDSKDSKKLPVQ